jgi:hypothetical protein
LRRTTTRTIGTKILSATETCAADKATYVHAPIIVKLAYASEWECKILAGIAQNVSRMIPPKLAVNIPAAIATSGLPFAPLKPLFAPITQKAPMLIASK